MSSEQASLEIEMGERFAFGENWAEFLRLVDDERIAAAEASLAERLGSRDLSGQTFVDVGSGSGLFSLAARNLGAQVTSFDFDPQSVACTSELRRRYHRDDLGWQVLDGSALDPDFMGSLGTFDIVYSWGVLHHTGDMWTALRNAEALANPSARLFIAIYNYQGPLSRRWRQVKKAYCEGGPLQRKVILEASRFYISRPDLAFASRSLRRLRGKPVPQAATGTARGMDRERDLVDWVGGYPFEVAKPEEIFDFFHSKGWQLDELTTCGGGLGCNEFVFSKS